MYNCGERCERVTIIKLNDSILENLCDKAQALNLHDHPSMVSLCIMITIHTLSACTWPSYSAPPPILQTWPLRFVMSIYIGNMIAKPL